jgi:hypothetical protein
MGHLDWANAVLGAIISGVFAGSSWVVRWLWDRRLMRRFLGDLVAVRKTVHVFIRSMRSRDGTYVSTIRSEGLSSGGHSLS